MDKRYDIEFFINNTNILVFRAFLVNSQSYRLIPLDGFSDVNENYKKLFLRIIEGKYKVKYYDKTDLEKNEQIKPQYIEVNEDSAIKNIMKVQNIDKQLVGVSIKSKVIILKEMVAFRYEGYSLNLADGLLPKNANKVSNITTELISTICANNTNFGEVFQMESYAGSTVIPFKSEKIDNNVIKTLIKIIADINNNKIDVDYMKCTNRVLGKLKKLTWSKDFITLTFKDYQYQYDEFCNNYTNFSELYKHIIKKLKKLTTIKGLEKFEIIFDKEKYSINNLKNLNTMSIYNEYLKGNAEVRYYEGQLKSRKNRFVLVVEEEGKDIRLHFDEQDENFEKIFKQVKLADQGKKITYSGYSEGEEVILLDSLVVQ